MSDTLVISIDAMGGDHAPDSIIEGVSIALKKNEDVFFFLYGNEEKLMPLIEKYKIPAERYKILHTDAII